MRSFESACKTFGIKVTGRQRRKFNTKQGLAYRLADHFAGQEEVSDEAKELYILDMSVPGPNPDKKEKDTSRTARRTRKEIRNERKIADTLRQKNHKRDKRRRRQEYAKNAA